MVSSLDESWSFAAMSRALAAAKAPGGDVLACIVHRCPGLVGHELEGRNDVELDPRDAPGGPYLRLECRDGRRHRVNEACRVIGNLLLGRHRLRPGPGGKVRGLPRERRRRIVAPRKPRPSCLQGDLLRPARSIFSCARRRASGAYVMISGFRDAASSAACAASISACGG